MDDSHIKQLTEEVLSQLAGPRDPVASDLESRVAALERALRELQHGARPAAAVVVAHAVTHPALRVLEAVPCGEDRCVLEPDKPCEKSGRCRTWGH